MSSYISIHQGATLSPRHREATLLTEHRNSNIAPKLRARTGLEVGPSTVTELQHPAGSPHSNSHRLLQCAQTGTMPLCMQLGTSDFGSTSGIADPECMPRLHVRDYLPNLKTVVRGGSYASSLMFSATDEFRSEWVRYEHEIQLKESVFLKRYPDKVL